MVGEANFIAAYSLSLDKRWAAFPFKPVATNKGKTVNQVAWTNPPPTQATTNLQSMVDKPVDYAAVVRNQFARAEDRNRQTYKNPLGAYTTADVRDKSIRAFNQGNQQDLGMALGNAAQQSSQNQFNRQATVAGLTAPQLYNASSSQKFTGGDVAGIGTSIASGLLTKGSGGG